MRKRKYKTVRFTKCVKRTVLFTLFDYFDDGLLLSLRQRAFNDATVYRGGTVGENSVGAAHGVGEILLGDILGWRNVGVGACVFVSFLAAQSVFFRPVTRFAVRWDPAVALAAEGDARHALSRKRVCGAGLDARITALAASIARGTLGLDNLVEGRVGDDGYEILGEGMLLGVADAVESELSKAGLHRFQLV